MQVVLLIDLMLRWIGVGVGVRVGCGCLLLRWNETWNEWLWLRVKNLVYICGGQQRQTLLRRILIYLHRICLLSALVVRLLLLLGVLHSWRIWQLTILKLPIMCCHYSRDTTRCNVLAFVNGDVMIGHKGAILAFGAWVVVIFGLISMLNPFGPSILRIPSSLLNALFQGTAHVAGSLLPTTTLLHIVDQNWRRTCGHGRVFFVLQLFLLVRISILSSWHI